MPGLLKALVLCATALGVKPMCAQEALSCRLGQIKERVPAHYPDGLDGRIVEGTITLLTDFAPDGHVTSSKPVAGPAQLRFDAQAYINGWRAEPAAERRSCMISLAYRFDGSQAMCSKRTRTTVEVERTDDTHVTLHLHCDLW